MIASHLLITSNLFKVEPRLRSKNLILVLDLKIQYFKRNYNTTSLHIFLREYAMVKEEKHLYLQEPQK